MAKKEYGTMIDKSKRNVCKAEEHRALMQEYRDAVEFQHDEPGHALALNHERYIELLEEELANVGLTTADAMELDPSPKDKAGTVRDEYGLWENGELVCKYNHDEDYKRTE